MDIPVAKQQKQCSLKEKKWLDSDRLKSSLTQQFGPDKKWVSTELCRPGLVKCYLFFLLTTKLLKSPVGTKLEALVDLFLCGALRLGHVGHSTRDFPGIQIHGHWEHKEGKDWVKGGLGELTEARLLINTLVG